MLKTAVSISSLLLAVAILLLGSGLLGTTVALRSGLEGFSETLTGFIMSGFFLGYLLGAQLAPWIVRRVGHIRAFAALAAAGCVAVLLQGLVVHPAVWWLLRVATGASMLGLYLVIESWLNAIATHGLRGRVFGIYMAVNLLALASSQYLILIYGPAGIAPFALVAIFFALALIPVTLTRLQTPAPQVGPELGLVRLYRISPLGAVSALASGLVTGAFWGMGPLFVRSLGVGTGGVALFMSAVVFGGAVLQWPIGHLSDRYDRRTVLAGVVACGATAASVAFMLAGLSVPGLMVSALIYGGFAFSVYALAVAHTNDHLAPGEVLAATRGLLFLNGIGSTAGPLLAGLTMHLTAPRFFMLYAAAVLFCLAVLALHRIRAVPPIPAEEQGGFVPMARTSPVVLELDPRAEVQPELELGR